MCMHAYTHLAFKELITMYCKYIYTKLISICFYTYEMHTYSGDWLFMVALMDIAEYLFFSVAVPTMSHRQC